MKTITFNSQLAMPIGEIITKNGEQYKVVDNAATVIVTAEKIEKRNWIKLKVRK